MEDYAIVPEPVFFVEKTGSFVLKSSVHICFENMGQNASATRQILSSFRKMYFNPTAVGQKEEGCLVFILNEEKNSELGEEGYLVEVCPDGITVSANTEVGLLYGFQTFVQMLPEDVCVQRYRSITLPCCTILDYPCFPWRGCEIDVQHFYCSVQQLKRYVGLLSSYKINHLYWRLDVGQLSDVDFLSLRATADSVSGFYDNDEVRDFLRYAEAHAVEVIPEINGLANAEAAVVCREKVADLFDLTVNDWTLGIGAVGSDTVVACWRLLPVGSGAPSSDAGGCDFSVYQADARYHPHAHDGFVSLSRTYRFKPADNGAGARSYFCSDSIKSTKQFEFMLLPRLCAFAEAMWTGSAKKDWPRFRRQVERHKVRLSTRGFNYCNGSFTPQLHRFDHDGDVEILLESEVFGTEFAYTVDGSDPTERSSRYCGPLSLTVGTVLKVLPIYGGKACEGVYTFEIK